MIRDSAQYAHVTDGYKVSICDYSPIRREYRLLTSRDKVITVCEVVFARDFKQCVIYRDELPSLTWTEYDRKQFN